VVKNYGYLKIKIFKVDQVFNFLFSQYSSYSDSFIFLEFFAVSLNITSVIYAKQNNILVYPTGLIGTGIFVYILFNFSLLGDMIINGYFFIMSIYGWYYWSRKKDEVLINNISRLEKKEYIQLIFLALGSLLFIYFIYYQFDKWNSWTAYVDTITTAIFFVAMWLMAKRKVESWIFWIIGDIITVPLYFYKGLTISSIQYLIFTVLAILGYLSWKKILLKNSH
jgi:nicotinamide mononucleotide transporter